MYRMNLRKLFTSMKTEAKLMKPIGLQKPLENKNKNLIL